jgi:DNA-binding MarR family transcriptional regulator
MTNGSSAAPLSPAEEDAWRTLIRLMIQLPRAVDEDLTARGGISLTNYVVLMALSEAPSRSLRMGDLAEAASVSPSRMTRIVQAMVRDGLVTRHTAKGDARSSVAKITPSGMRRLRAAWPAHVQGVRALVFDHLDPAEVADLHRVATRMLWALGRST